MRPFFGPVLNCALMDQLKARAVAGDKRALQIVLASAPNDASRAIAIAERVEIIRQLAAMLRGGSTARTDHAVAVIISVAGDVLQKRSRLGELKEFERLSIEEREQLESTLTAALTWSPISKGRRWLTVRQVIAILKR